MAELNHTIVNAKDRWASARFLTEVLGLPEPKEWAHFVIVDLGNGVSLDFADASGEITPQHYAFLVSEEEFDHGYGLIVERDLDHWADPRQQGVRQINHHDGGRGVYFLDPSGHFLELITRPYGAGG